MKSRLMSRFTSRLTFRLTSWLFAAICLGSLVSAAALAASPKDVLIVANETGPNSLDIHGVGANRPSYGVAWLVYDRLITHGRKKLPDGTLSYDYSKIEPELAESWVVAKDGLSVTFKLRKNATFHDGTPVTAKDVKWSYDRALAMGGFPQFQMKAGSLEKPEQFEVVDEHTFRVSFPRRDKMSLPDMAVPVASIYNSTLAMKNATPDDPWAANWLKNNAAGGGAYKVESWKPGQEIVYARFDNWKSGPMPKLRRVIQREVPSAGNRRALLERGDIDMTYEMPPKDFQELSKAGGKLHVASVPVENAVWYVGMNVTKPPFDNVKVRQAVAYAIPYEQLMAGAFYGRAVKLWGGAGLRPGQAAWPTPHPYKTDLAQARKLMQQAGYADGFETTLSYDLGQGTISEPVAILMQESLAKIGIKLVINKVPGANWRAAMLKKDMPLIVNRFGGWLNYPEYFFYWTYHGQNAVFNTMSYQNPELDRLVEAARFEADKKKYENQVRDFIEVAYKDVPRVPIAQPVMDVAMQKNVSGYTYWFHLQPDYRQIVKQ
ncbi:MAG TPA: ABC transporter substrate-binding protein [Rhodocyclaceae bacterium]|nr:ABC transporter substrate-binding protein [Rhodocyclaceae bacterium]